MSRWSVKTLRTWQYVIAMGCGALLSARAAELVPPDQLQASSDELLEFVVQQNETSRSMLPAAMSYTFKYDRPLFVTGAQIKTHGRGDGRVVLSGQNRFVEIHRTTTRQRIGDQDSESADFVERWVLNPRFLAWWHVGRSPVQIIEHKSIDNMSDRARRLIAMTRAPEPALYAYGIDDLWLRQAIESPGSVWEAQSVTEGGATKFQLLCFSSPNPRNGMPRLVVEIDPSQGFCITRTVSYAHDGSIGVLQIICNRQVAPNVWLPELVEQTMYLSWMGKTAQAAAERMTTDGAPLPNDGRQIAGRLRVEFGTIELAHGIADGHFELSMLGVEDGHHAVRVDLNGNPAREVINHKEANR